MEQAAETPPAGSIGKPLNATAHTSLGTECIEVVDASTA